MAEPSVPRRRSASRSAGLAAVTDLVIRDSLLVDGRMVGSDQLADAERDLRAEGRHLFTCERGMRERLGRLVPHPLHDGDAAMAEDHERVLRVPHRAGEFELDDLVQRLDRIFSIEFHGKVIPRRSSCHV